MINCDDCVMISDDDTPVQVHEALKTKSGKRRRGQRDSRKSTSIETIVVIDDDIRNCNNINDNNNVIEIPDSHNSEKDQTTIQKNDVLFAAFIEKCMDLEDSDHMIRIVNRTVIRAYEESDIEYRKSDKFERLLFKSLKRLETDPDHKFSHVKDVVETLKFHKHKRRAELTTLATNLKENSHHRNAKFNSIVLDSDDEQKEIPTINLDDYNEIVDLDRKTDDEEKENQREVQENGMSNSQENFLVPQVEFEDKENQREVKENVISSSQENFLVPQAEVAWEPGQSQELAPADGNQKFNTIIAEIAWCKEQITHLDEAEVNDDSISSPYILCEKYKLKVVQLYKDLCQLTGNQPIKQRKVRLQVLEGHPPGPVKRLQSFINDNIGEDGYPLFPDFCDVIKCVMVANIEDKLGWNKQQVTNEAHCLFTQCGRALQKQRQRREYRDLLAKVKLERPEADPADEDPELLRKLEQNRKVAVKNENDLLERYVNLQYLPPQKHNPGQSSEMPNQEAPAAEKDDLNDAVDDQQNSPRSDLVSDEDSNFEPPEVKLRLEEPEVSLCPDNDTNKTDLDKDAESKVDNAVVKVKQEPIDIVQLLEELGDNYTVSVIDIEDPHLVIEISSDDESSSEESISLTSV